MKPWLFLLFGPPFFHSEARSLSETLKQNFPENCATFYETKGLTKNQETKLNERGVELSLPRLDDVSGSRTIYVDREVIYSAGQVKGYVYLDINPTTSPKYPEPRLGVALDSEGKILKLAAAPGTDKIMNPPLSWYAGFEKKSLGDLPQTITEKSAKGLPSTEYALRFLKKILNIHALLPPAEAATRFALFWPKRP